MSTIFPFALGRPRRAGRDAPPSSAVGRPATRRPAPRSRAARLLQAAAAIAVFTAGGLIGLAQAAGFDCRKAVKSAEHAICAEPSLADADRRQSALYAGLLDGVPADLRDNLRRSQRDFLRRRDGCAANVPCLQSEYLWRHHELCGVAKLLGRDCQQTDGTPR